MIRLRRTPVVIKGVRVLAVCGYGAPTMGLWTYPSHWKRFCDDWRETFPDVRRFTRIAEQGCCYDTMLERVQDEDTVLRLKKSERQTKHKCKIQWRQCELLGANRDVCSHLGGLREEEA